ncbi:TPA: hypothetical protein ACH3X2_002560 [Trebouxia sp. C0005]
MCGAPEAASTLTYIYEDEALSSGYRLVQKTSEEGRKLQSQTNWRTSDFVWVPANPQVLPVAPKPRAKKSREAEEYQGTSVTTDLLCSAACCLLGASDGAEAVQLLETLNS